MVRFLLASKAENILCARFRPHNGYLDPVPAPLWYSPLCADLLGALTC